eukprot:4560367-Pyramimonas_sp.AAC.1
MSRLCVPCSWPAVVMRWVPDGPRRRGRPRTRWTDYVRKFLLSKRFLLQEALRQGKSFPWNAPEDEYLQLMTNSHT